MGSFLSTPKIKLPKKSHKKSSKYEEEYFVPGVYMTDSYRPENKSAPQPKGLSASATKTGPPTVPPTANVSSYSDMPEETYLNNTHPVGTNTGDAMPLSPMVEHEAGSPVNILIVILIIISIVFMSMRK
jgi:hypothetical protein